MQGTDKRNSSKKTKMPETLVKHAGRKDSREKGLKRKGSGIKGTLLKAFLVPVVLIIILGSVSCLLATNMIKKKVEESSRNTISAMGMYCSLLTGNVSAKALEMSVGENLSSYLKYAKVNQMKAAQYLNKVRKDFIQAEASVQYIYSFHLIAEGSAGLTSMPSELGENAWQGFMDSGEGKYLQENMPQGSAWLGSHSFLDQQLSISPERYGVSFYQKLPKRNAYLVLDISTASVEEILAGMDFGENSIKAMVSPDGREIVRIQSGDKSTVMETGDEFFNGKDFYRESKQAGGAGSRYVEYGGEKYLYVFAPAGETGIMLCGLIPQSNIVEEVHSIRNLTIAMILLACVIAFVTGSRIATKMGRAVKSMTEGMGRAAQGDLTQEFCTESRDELGILANGLNDMLASMRILMKDMQKFGVKVKEMADGVAENCPVNDLGWEIYPEGIGEVCRKVYGVLKKPIYITENGTCDNGDRFRARYIAEHLRVLCESGLPVERYYHWCFCDNWEWVEGTSARFGLVHVDFETQARTVKDSGAFYKRVIQERGVSEALYEAFCGGEYPKNGEDQG